MKYSSKSGAGTVVKKYFPNFKKTKNPLDRLPLGKWAGATIVFGLVISGLSLLALLVLPPEIPLYYGAGEPRNQIAPAWKIVFPSLIALLGSAINFLLALAVNNDFLKKTLVVASISISILAALTTLKIFLLVASI